MYKRQALRSAYYLVTKKNPEPDAFKAVRGLDGWKEAEFDLDGTDIKVAVASGLGNTRRLMNAIKKGEEMCIRDRVMIGGQDFLIYPRLMLTYRIKCLPMQHAYLFSFIAFLNSNANRIAVKQTAIKSATGSAMYTALV